MGLPDHIQQWLKNYHHDRGAMEELRNVLIQLDATESINATLVKRIELILEVIDLSGLKAADLAKLVHMSERSMDRKLQAYGTTFRHLLDEERKRRYQRMCMESGYKLAHIADRLGFSDVRSLFRARNRWFSQSFE